MPDATVLSDSCDTVYLCDPLPDHEGLVVIPISHIQSVVAMFPEMVINQGGNIEHTGKFSLMRHAYIELSKYTVDGFNDDNSDSDNE